MSSHRCSALQSPGECDYLLALEAGYNRQLDAMGHWAVSVSSDARWQREQFFASLLSAPLSGADDIGNARLI